MKERDLGWASEVARCAERFVALGALKSSGFRLALADLVVKELEVRCGVYLECGGAAANFDGFFEAQKSALCSNIQSRFGFDISTKPWPACDLLQEKCRARTPSPKEKRTIGFHN